MTLFNKKHFYIINYTIIDGQYEYGDNFLIETKPEDLLIDTEKAFQEFFGSDTKKEKDTYTDGERSLKIGRCQELTKEEYAVLRRYI